MLDPKAKKKAEPIVERNSEITEEIAQLLRCGHAGHCCVTAAARCRTDEDCREHRRGLRFYVDRAPLPGVRRRADLVFPRRRVAVYVDGCFWHRCPLHATDPKNNAEWWADKLAGNVKRDRDTDSRLAAAGWTVIRVWEHEDPITAATRVAEALTPPPGP